MKPGVWTNTESPTEVGLYLRINIGRTISVHRVKERDGKLHIHWGFNEENGWLPVTHGKIVYERAPWWWFRLPPIPPEALSDPEPTPP